MERPPQKDPVPRGAQRVLDHGFVHLVDSMGDDGAVVQAARVSYGKGTKGKRSDAALISYLMRHRHTSPFEMVQFKFLMRLPVFVARQMVRHRTASINEYSARYSILPNLFYIPAPDAVRLQSTRKKQGGDDVAPRPIVAEFVDRMKGTTERCYQDYEWAIEQGISREISRILLPVNIYTEWYWRIDLHNLLHFLKLRLNPLAQHETTIYAQAIARLARPIAPMSFEAFDQYILEGISFSRREQGAIRRILTGASIPDACQKAGLGEVRSSRTLASGEAAEFLEKLETVSRAGNDSEGEP